MTVYITDRADRAGTTEYEAQVIEPDEESLPDYYSPVLIESRSFPTLADAQAWVEKQVPADLVTSRGRHGEIRKGTWERETFIHEGDTILDGEWVKDEGFYAYFDGAWDLEGEEG